MSAELPSTEQIFTETSRLVPLNNQLESLRKFSFLFAVLLFIYLFIYLFTYLIYLFVYLSMFILSLLLI